MRKDFVWQIVIHNPGQLLLAGLVLCFIGMILTTAIMSAISGFFYYKLPLKGKPGNSISNPPRYARFSIMDIQLRRRKIWEIIQGMDAKTKEAVKWQLQVDYYFMPFAYLFILFTGMLAHLKNNLAGDLFDQLYLIIWLPLVAWVFDIIENNLLAAALTSQEKSGKGYIFIISRIKWLIAIACLVTSAWNLISK
jgi:hypothetical protein